MIARFARRERTRGQALAEFAMVVPLFLLLLFGIVDIGRYVYGSNALSQSAREAARAGSVAYGPNDCDALVTRVECVKAVAVNRAIGVLVRETDVAVSCQRLNAAGNFATCAGTWKADDRMTVTIETDLNLVTPLIAQWLGTVEMTGSATVTLD